MSKKDKTELKIAVVAAKKEGTITEEQLKQVGYKRCNIMTFGNAQKLDSKFDVAVVIGSQIDLNELPSNLHIVFSGNSHQESILCGEERGGKHEKKERLFQAGENTVYLTGFPLKRDALVRGVHLACR